jgi:hypothetical protein
MITRLGREGNLISSRLHAPCPRPQSGTVSRSMATSFTKIVNRQHPSNPQQAGSKVIDSMECNDPAFVNEAAKDLPAKTGETANFEAAASTVPQTTV